MSQKVVKRALVWPGWSRAVRMWMGVGCPCPPVHNDITSPRYLLQLRPEPDALWRKQKSNVPKTIPRKISWNANCFLLCSSEDMTRMTQILSPAPIDQKKNLWSILERWRDDGPLNKNVTTTTTTTTTTTARTTARTTTNIYSNSNSNKKKSLIMDVSSICQSL